MLNAISKARKEFEKLIETKILLPVPADLKKELDNLLKDNECKKDQNDSQQK